MENYTINGTSYTEEQLQGFSDKRGITIEDYKSELTTKYGEDFSIDPAVNVETNAGSNTNTVSNSDEDFLELLIGQETKIEPLTHILEDEESSDNRINLSIGEGVNVWGSFFGTKLNIDEIRFNLGKRSKDSDILNNYPEYKELLQRYNNFETIYDTGKYSEKEIAAQEKKFNEDLIKFNKNYKDQQEAKDAFDKSLPGQIQNELQEGMTVKRDNIQNPFEKTRMFKKLQALELLPRKQPEFANPNKRDAFKVYQNIENGLFADKDGKPGSALTTEDIAILKEKKNLNIELGFYENDSNTDPNTLNVEYSTDDAFDFVSRHFSPDELIKLGIDPTDFAGWLEKNDITLEFLENVENGLYERGFSPEDYLPSFLTGNSLVGGVQGMSMGLYGDVIDAKNSIQTGDYTSTPKEVEEKLLKVAKQKALFGMLDQYMVSRNDVAKNTQFYHDYFNNPTEYESDLTESEARLRYQKKGIAAGYIELLNVQGEERFIDHRSLYQNPMPYVESVFNTMYKQTESNNKALAQKVKDIKARGAVHEAFAGPVNFLGGGIQGFTGAVDEVTDYVADLFPGSDIRSQRRNLLQIEMDEMNPTKSLDYFSVWGNGVEFEGDYYLKDSDNKIYNISEGYNVDSVLDPTVLSKIDKKIDEEGTYMSDFSYRGGMTQTGDIIGNVVFQILGAKGLGMGRVALSTKYIARVNKARKLKGLAPLNTRIRNFKTGKFSSTKTTFGLNLSNNPIAKVLNITNAKAASYVDIMMFQSFYGAATGRQRTLFEAQKAGIPFEQAKKLANEASVKMAVLYAATALIAPRIKASEAMDKFLISSGTINRAIKGFKTSGPQGFRNSLRSSFDKYKTGFLINANTFAREGTKEVFQENIQQAGEIYGINPGLNEEAGVDFKQVEISKQDFINTSILSAVAGGLIPVSGNIASSLNNKSSLNQRITDLYMLSRDMKGTSKRFQYLVDKKAMSKQDMLDLMADVKAIGSQYSKMPAFMLNDPGSFIEGARILEEIEQAQNRKEKLAKPLQYIEDAKILELTGQLENIIDLSSKKQVRQDIENVKKFDKSTKVYKSDEDGTVEEKMRADGVITSEEDLIKLEADGFMEIDGQIIINEDVAIYNQAVSVASHELLHKILRSEIKNNPKIGKIINEFRNILKKKGLLKDIESEIKAAGYKVTFNEDGTVEGSDIDEYMNKFSDAIRKNLISKNDLSEGLLMDIGRQIVNFIKSIGGLRDVEFKSGQDVFNFIRDYSINIEKGKLTSQAKAKLKSSKGVTADKEKLSVTALDAINKLVPETVKTKEEYLDRNVFNPAYKATLEGGVINNYIRSKSTSPEQAAEALENVQDRLINYNPGATRKKANGDPITFGEFIFSNVNFGKLDANKKLAIKAKENKRKESLDSDQAKQVANPDSKVQTKAKPKFKNLKDSNVLSKETISSIESKTIKVVRVLKSKLDADSSINKTVSSLVSELKSEIGKQADIDLKKAMGGKANNRLNKFLLKNKKAILENMTTTWLVSGMPFAIQKQVNEKFTSDWQGKKIDREKVDTDQAGRTSGAQIIRRLPNVANNITDDQFLTYMFNKDGSIIRGRKESLAKAIAEEVALDIFSSEVKNPESDLSKAFEKNQEAQGVVLFDNYINDISRQVERGNVKFSRSNTNNWITTPEGIKATNKLFKEVQKKGLDNTIDDNGVIFTDPEKYKAFPGLGNIVKNAFDNGIVLDRTMLQFMKAVQKSEFISEEVKELVIRALTSKSSTKTVLDDFASDMKVLANALGKDITDIIGFEGLGFYNRLLDSAKKKIDVEATSALAAFLDANRLEEAVERTIYLKNEDGSFVKGQYYTYLENIKNKQPNSKKLPENLDLDMVSPINSKNGIGGKISRIQDNGKTLKEKKEAYRLLIPEIKNANVHNKLLATHIIKVAIDLLKKNKISPSSFINLLQAQTNAVNGLRSLTGLQFVTLMSGKQGNIKGEHLADNGGSMFKFVELGFQDMGKVELDFEINKVINFHDQWLENRNVLDFVDAFGKNNPFKYLRIRLLPDNYLANVFTYDLRPAEDLILKNEQAIRSLDEAKFSLSGLDQVMLDQKALNQTFKASYTQNPKGISIWDFDDTLAQTKSNVLYTLPDGTKGKIDATEFALKSAELESQGAKFDFSEFNEVMKGKKGPMFDKAVGRNKKFGNSDVFILTARPQGAAFAIHKFLKAAGLDIRIENIVGLENGTAKAKADWMIGKIADGYNDFYFADDAIKNVKAVKQIYDNFDIKGKVQQAKVKYSITLSSEFNKMIERQTKVDSFKEFSKVVARRRGKQKGKYKFFLPPSAEDFRGLTQYTFAGKGKQGEADQAFFEDALMTPYFKGVAAMENARQVIKNDAKGLLKAYKPVVKKLNKLIIDGDFTYDAAVRVYLWTKAGYEIPGISKRDQGRLNALVVNDPELKGYADGLLLISKMEVWPKPSEFWDTQTTLSDLNSLTEKINRKEYLAQFIENVDIIFSDANLNKIEALYGAATASAIKDSITRMKTGSNRATGNNSINNKWLNWINNSVGTIMFFNRRSALLQLISSTNFINWSDNNILKAGLAFANQPQYWSDFAMIFNSNKLKQRRGGLKSDVQEAEIANAAKNSTDKANAVISYLLKIGFTPTQIADSFAIASGGAAMYRNRVNTYVKEGMSKADAEAKAFEDFSKISDEAQQSGDPALVSQQQASMAGRLILAFQNTPMQYTRLMKKSAKDLINGRGDAKTHISKIIYYGAIQNFIFNALSTALFAMLPGFDDEEDTEEDVAKQLDKKSARILNGMVDSILRGSGIYGAIVATVKNTIKKFYEQEKKGFTADHTYTIIEATNLSPPIGSKLRKVYSAIQTSRFDKDVIAKQGWDITLDGRYNPSPKYQVLGNLTSALFNLPLDRALMEMQGISEALDSRNTQMQRIALGLGWRTWDVNAKNEEFDLIKIEAKALRKKLGYEKGKATREINKMKKEMEYLALSPAERLKLEQAAAKKRSDAARKGAITRKRNKKTKDSISAVEFLKLMN